LGVSLGDLIQAVATAAGLSAILLSSEVAFNVVKYLDAAFLIFLGVRRLLSRDDDGAPQTVKRTSLRRTFKQGFFVGISNPKTPFFFIAFLPQFVNPARGSIWQHMRRRMRGETSFVTVMAADEPRCPRLRVRPAEMPALASTF
jgi:threonine/homoserine/homoserine lactone efflux protein